MCGRSIAGRLRALWCGRPSEAERDVEAGGGTIAEGLRQTAAPLPRVEGESGVRYDLLHVVGKGGFGEVYKAAVVDACALPPLVAIKAERTESLEMEVRVLEAVAPSVHFCALLDRGLDPQSGCPFVVMSLLGPNLSVVRKAMPGQRLSLSTADDVESWLYSLVELAVGRLPWAALDKQAKDATFRAKLDVRRAHRHVFFAPLPHQFDHARVFYIDLMHVMETHGFSFADEYDWERVFEGYSASAGAE
ncbi:CK1/TTBK protein kinase [Aphelenchoides fujianensis]|nr:CK1/TTBK protein kinase [Aphelenchoides fujianensis]